MKKLLYLSVFAFVLGACSPGSQKATEEKVEEITEVVEDEVIEEEAVDSVEAVVDEADTPAEEGEESMEE